MIVKVFEAGEFPQGKYPIERVKRLVDAYDPQGFIEACVVVGHFDNFLAEREELELAHGWVKSLSINESGEVYADIPNETISKKLAGWIVTKQLRYVSSEIFPFDEEDDKQSPYLIRVAFLGRSIPQIPTTKIPSAFSRALSLFGLAQKKETVENRFTWTGKIESSAIEQLQSFCGLADNNPLNWKTNFRKDTGIKSGVDIDGPGEDTKFNQGEKMNEEEVQALRAENEQLKTENKNLKIKVDDFESRVLKEKITAKLEKFRDEGKILPSRFESIKENVLKMSVEGQDLYFSTLEDSVPIVDLDEKHFALKSSRTESGQTGITEKIRAFARENNLSYDVAWEQLKRERPELFEEV